MLIAGPNPSPASSGQALALVSNASATDLTDELTRLGYRATAIDDPYAAMVELLDRPLVYRAFVVSLPALYREELSIIRAVRARLPHIDVLLAHTDGRHAALAEAMRLGATGLLSDEAIHRLADIEPTAIAERPSSNETESEESELSRASTRANRESEPDEDVIEPLLTAEELRALLHEEPTMPPQQ